jgi:hypothetical protein
LCDSQFHCTCISDIYNVTELILNRENIFEFLYCIRFLSHCDLPLSLMSRSNKFIFYFKFVSLDLGCVFLQYYSASFAHSIPSFRTVFFFLDLISYSFHMLSISNILQHLSCFISSMYFKILIIVVLDNNLCFFNKFYHFYSILHKGSDELLPSHCVLSSDPPNVNC